MIDVKLLAFTQANEEEYDPEALLASYKRICNTNESWESIIEKQTPEDVEKRITGALRVGHMGIFEHLSFTFLITGVSRVMTHQLVRHRMASYLQTSQRAVRMDELKIVIPPDADIHKETYKDVEQALRTIYQDLIDAGVKPEDARYIMPHGMETRIIVTMNGRSLLHFFKLRLGKHAQWEIQDTANQMLTLVREKMPTIFCEELMEYWE